MHILIVMKSKNGYILIPFSDICFFQRIFFDIQGLQIRVLWDIQFLDLIMFQVKVFKAFKAIYLKMAKKITQILR